MYVCVECATWGLHDELPDDSNRCPKCNAPIEMYPSYGNIESIIEAELGKVCPLLNNVERKKFVTMLKTVAAFIESEGLNT